ncbi:hypothetical protein ACFPYN_15055 [Paenisporosarcina macmurdoensis]|uniref:Uncharacterized protein n=1 Tax=Paenisporosarcina macmurdoensis TaxID=212659 RepID=A0ABW1LAL9_9BACL
MKVYYRWGVFVLLIALTVLLINKGMDLRSLGTNVDGTGIGVHFLFLEINDRVPENSIPSYANGFFIVSLMTALAALVLAGLNLLRFKGTKAGI